MTSALTSMFNWLCDNLGIFGVFISLCIIMFWWVIAIFALIAVALVIVGIYLVIDFLRHPVRNYRELKEKIRREREEEARRREYLATHEYTPLPSSSDDSSSGSDSGSGGEPNNGGGPDEYGPSPGYGGMGGP